jgi:hypothetical protein
MCARSCRHPIRRDAFALNGEFYLPALALKALHGVVNFRFRQIHR